MKKVIILLVMITIFYIQDIKAQVTQEWVATYSGVGAGSNVPKKSLVDKGGNIIVAGRSANSSFNDDFITLKYNPSGNLLWERRYNGIGNGNDAIAAAVIDDSDNIYVTGYSQEGAALGGYNWVTIKYFPNGDTAWKRSFNWTANGTDEPFAMAIDKGKNLCITGYARITPPIDDDLITIKYNSDGDLLWSKAYASTTNGQDWGYSIATDDSNKIYVTGYVSVFPGNRVTTIKYNSNGDTEWVQYFPTNYGDYLRPAHVAVDKNNDVIVNGYYYLGEQYAFNTIKYNSTGDLMWNRIYKGAGNLNFCFALGTDDSANVYVAGRSTNAVTDADFVTIKYNKYGDTLWIRNYDGGFDNFDEARSIAIDNFQNVYVTGLTDSSNGSSNYTTIKYDRTGTIIWLKKYRGNYADDIATSLSLDINNSVFVSGYTQTSLNNYSIATIKYSQLTGIFENTNFINSDFRLYQNYPNPFNPITIINYFISEDSEVKIRIYSILGKELETLLNRKQIAGKFEVTFDGSKYPSGIYFYDMIINGNTIDTKRMLLIK